MVLTGVQGTGKTVLGAIIALVIRKACSWRVSYTWNGVTCVFGDETVIADKTLDKSKTIQIVDCDVDSHVYPYCDYALLVLSVNENRWHDLAQQSCWTSVGGNYYFLDPVPLNEIKAIAA